MSRLTSTGLRQVPPSPWRSRPARARVIAIAAALAWTALGLAAARSPTAIAASAEWQLEALRPPGLEAPDQPPVGLGHVGDIQFWAPNRAVLITAGNGSAVPAGVWAYDGVRWHELATVCGAGDGRIAWAGPDRFWTVSDGRPGQAANPATGEPAPLVNRTLCDFAGAPVQVVGSYASLAFEASSYQEMHAAACLSETDCWFAGDVLPEGQIGAFHLHWDGSSIGEQPDPQGHSVQNMVRFGRYLYEGVRLSPGDLLSEPEPFPPSVLHRISPAGYQPTFLSLSTRLPDYSQGELPEALDGFTLSSDAEALWAAAGPSPTPPEDSTAAEVTVLRYQDGAWKQLLGPTTDPPGGNPLSGYTVTAVAADPSGGAWLALVKLGEAGSPSPLAGATIVHVGEDGSLSTPLTLPRPGSGVGPKGAAEKLACPAVGDCWLVTSQGWLFHLQEGQATAPDSSSPLTALIQSRPIDQGLPQVQPDAPPADDSGLNEESVPPFVPVVESTEKAPEARVAVTLLSHVKTRLVHRYTLELRFHLAVRARVRLLAKRNRSVVASTRMSTLAAGNRRLLLALDPHRWPTKLALQTHALRALPTVPAGQLGEEGSGGGGGGGGVVVSALRFPARLAHRGLAGPW